MSEAKGTGSGSSDSSQHRNQYRIFQEGKDIVAISLPNLSVIFQEVIFQKSNIPNKKYNRKHTGTHHLTATKNPVIKFTTVYVKMYSSHRIERSFRYLHQYCLSYGKSHKHLNITIISEKSCTSYCLFNI